MKKRFPWHSVDPSLPKAEYDAAVLAKLKSRCRLLLETGCWEYLGTRNHQGYGFLNYRSRPWAVHRLAPMLVGKPIPEDKQACHRCDFPPCCNPDHIFAGDQKLNSADMIAKGRNAKQQVTHCPRGHAYAEHGRPTGRNGWRACLACQRAKCRIATGWPADLAYSVPALKRGHRPDFVPFVEPPAKKARATHCKRGHELTGDNVYYRKNGNRQCRPCASAAAQRAHMASGLARASVQSKGGE